MYKRKKCDKEDILLIRDFLQETHNSFGEKVNWHIDRLNFTYSMSRIMNGVSEKAYRDAITMYYKGEVLVALILTEGEDRGEAFIEIKSLDMDRDLIQMIFDDLDKLGQKSNHDFVQLRLHSNANLLIDEAKKRSYVKVDWSEITMKKTLDQYEDDTLPEGYSFFSNDNFEDKANAHAHAFGYFERKDVLKNAESGLKALNNMPNYRKEFDIAIAYEGKEVSFATMWFDEKNKIGILEPVGTHEAHRRLGLGKSAIYRACNLIKKKGATAAYVGSDQDFYKSIGFKPVSEDYVYKKSLKRC